MKTYTATTWLQRLVSDRSVPFSKPTPLLIFVAGDKSQVGKSSSCLGLIGTLHEKMGYSSKELAYIKPATQCEGTQLITRYCEARAIACVGIGPVVFFSGFKQYLDDERYKL